ncbi:MAG TPA: thiamine diphosphokinase [Verrucomicrobiae bacterium]|nr:thiamine diphosphokinase [Verrucomicrobiae bacterium]
MRIGVICNGAVTDYNWLAAVIETLDGVICADGGSNHAYKLGIMPKLIIGDLDSVDPKVLSHYQSEGVTIKQFMAEKDDTDQRLALQEAIALGATEVVLLAALGKRLDHSLGSLSVLAYLHSQGVTGTILDETNEVTLREHQVIIEGEVGEEISLLPLTTRVTGITTENLQYALKDAVFELGNPYGISNVLTAPKARVTMAEGLLLVIKSRE